MIIPWQELETDTLDSLITEFILREGTDYGDYEVSLASKVREVKEQFQQNKLAIIWSEINESVNIVPIDSIHYMDE
ncbi:YheU family protein [Thorsellia anophelis]|uniref:Uncharacterized protein n=1 Tax=Thorsellia anophelis DSM 18579 TaxID=1123402 RepID=A0A1I0E5W9_9GAMM|nr:YheU family protein [Thorsellia anophelis]SET40431.1 hypothetical protein SAMN02583745_02260 [Thorsellia anophelis DSM 18579]